MKLGGLLLLLLSNSFIANADISSTFRRANAVVLYEFNETDNIVRDTADLKYGSPINLTINPIGPYSRSLGVLSLEGPSQVISSTGAATKIYDQCQPKNEISVELWVRNRQSTKVRTGPDSNGVLQPLRILSYSSGLFSRNFSIGQFYDAGDMYSAAVRNSSNSTATDDRSLVEPLMSTPAATLVPAAGAVGALQKIVVTFKNGTARMYLTDSEGHFYLHKTASNGFTGNLTNWNRNAYLVLGNEYVSSTSFFSRSDTYSSCNPDAAVDSCTTNPNRYWEGKLSMVAIYCKELTPTEIFGTTLQTMTNPIFPIDTSLQVTPQLTRAQEIYTRLTGTKTPIVNPVLQQMVTKMAANDPLGAAALVTDNPSDSNFYNSVVRDFAAKMSHRDETITIPLNDFSATIIGAIRDEINSQRLLYDNLVYVGDPSKTAVPNNLEMDIIKSNNHYEALGSQRFDLKKVLMPSTQKIFSGTGVVAHPTPAGLLTSRQWMAQHLIAGTNRRPVEYAFREFLCTPIEKVADSTGPDNVIGRDIDRFPGGSHSKFTSTCRACHTIMDGFRGAYAYMTFSNNIVKHGFISPVVVSPADEATSFGMAVNPAYVTEKVNHNETVFPEGRVIIDDTWTNNAIYGANATTFDWAKTSGKGIKEFGQLIAGSKQFPQCMAKRVFQTLCKRDPASTDQTMLNEAATEFAGTKNYNLKFLFQKIVTSKECLGESK